VREREREREIEREREREISVTKYDRSEVLLYSRGIRNVQ